MADAGVPVYVLRKIAGHGSLVTTQRYLRPDAQSIADAAGQSSNVRPLTSEIILPTATNAAAKLTLPP